jgi:predicted DNA-binding ribbon-helix-helix protein
MNKYELKYMFEQETLKVENLIDVVEKNAHHIQDLSAELKKKDENIDKLIARLNDKREEVYKLKNIIQSQTQKNLREYHFGEESVDN